MEAAEKNVVYIGGCGGIGSSMCKLFAQKKVANLAILDLTDNSNLISDMKDLNSSTNVLFLKIDLRCKDTIEKCLNEVVSRIGPIHILINGSGLFNENDAELTIAVNLLGAINTTMTAMKLMDKSNGNHGGLIVNIASVAGLCPLRTSPIYSASKAGLILFTRSMAEQSDLNQSSVSLITICPGLTETGLLDQFTAESTSPFARIIERSFNLIKKQTPDECAQSIMKAIGTNKNGAVFICDVGEIEEVTFPQYWVPQMLKKKIIDGINIH